MTASPRPNLGGLFNGSTPPERSSTVAEALGPRGVRLTAVADGTPPSAASSKPAADDATGTGTATPRTPAIAAGSPAPDYHWPAPSWLDPLKAVEHYFSFLQTLLDANQRLAVSVVTTVVSLPHRMRHL